MSEFTCTTHDCRECPHLPVCTKDAPENVKEPLLNCPECDSILIALLADGSATVCFECGHRIEEEN